MDKNKKKSLPGNPAEVNPNPSAQEQPLTLDSQLAQIAEWLKKMKFRKNLFGGVSEPDVWKKIGELNTMYEQALRAERVRYDTLLEHFRKEYDQNTGSGKAGEGDQ